MFPILDWAFLVIELLKCGAKQSAKKVPELLYCYRLDIKSIQNNLKCVTSCNELVPKNCIRALGNQFFLKEGVIIEEGRSVGQSVPYWPRMVEVLKRHIGVDPSKKSMKVRMAKKKTGFCPMDTSYFSKPESRVRQRVLRISADCVF